MLTLKYTLHSFVERRQTVNASEAVSVNASGAPVDSSGKDSSKDWDAFIINQLGNDVFWKNVAMP